MATLRGQAFDPDSGAAPAVLFDVLWDWRPGLVEPAATDVAAAVAAFARGIAADADALARGLEAGDAPAVARVCGVILRRWRVGEIPDPGDLVAPGTHVAVVPMIALVSAVREERVLRDCDRVLRILSGTSD